MVPRSKPSVDNSWKERVFTAVIAAIVTIALGWMQYDTKISVESAAQKAAIKVEEVADKAETVKQTLDESNKVTDAKLDEVKKISSATHTLVNSASLVQLRLYAVAARRIATLTNDEADVDAATLAEKLVKEHESKQKKVDANDDS